MYLLTNKEVLSVGNQVAGTGKEHFVLEERQGSIFLKI
jgi:hypothetical protein